LDDKSMLKYERHKTEGSSYSAIIREIKLL